jgi:putative hydrolase of the HAD superfamily
VTKNKTAEQISVLLFDLGGVLLQLRETGSNFGVTGDERQFHRSWLLSPAVREFESGAIVAEVFAKCIIDELRLPYDWKEFLARFNRWPERLYQGAAELIETLGNDYKVALLSNTNAAHWARSDIAGVLEPLFDHAFLSFRTGLLKPDTNAFEQVLDHFDCQAGQILFFDDNPLNVDTASALGIRACLTRGLDDVRNALRANGVVFD